MSDKSLDEPPRLISKRPRKKQRRAVPADFLPKRLPQKGDVEFVTGAGRHLVELTDGLVLPVSQLLPVRRPAVYRGQTNMPSWYWSATGQRHLSCESIEEVSVATQLDLDPEVVAVAAQPFRLHFGSRKSHVPDFVAALSDGSIRVVDVTLAERLEASASLRQNLDQTRRACMTAGWQYEVIRDIDRDPVLVTNQRWIASFRRSLGAELQSLAQQLLEACDRPKSIGVLLDTAENELDTRPVLFHLVARGLLAMDLHDDMTNESLVWRPANAGKLDV
jgi:hypothetical protein